jgi:hypothetical protein
LPALTAFRPNRIDNVGHLTGEDLRSPLVVATKEKSFQNGRSELSRSVKVFALIAQEMHHTKLQFFVVDNTGPQGSRHILHWDRKFAYVKFRGANFTQVRKPVLQQFGLKLFCDPFADSILQKRNLSCRGGQYDFESLACEQSIAQRFPGANHFSGKDVRDPSVSKGKLVVVVRGVQKPLRAPGQVRFIEQEARPQACQTAEGGRGRLSQHE